VPHLVERPVKPKGDFPLRWHPRGGWCIKIHQKVYYFGKGDKHEAAKEFYRVEADLRAGRQPRPSPTDGYTVGMLTNDFLTTRRRRVDSGELSLQQWTKYYKAGKQLVTQLGAGRLVEDLRPADFGKLRVEMAKRYASPISLTRFITLTKTIFKYAYTADLVDRPVKFGDEYDKPQKRVVKLHEGRRGKLLVSADGARKLVEAASPQMRAMILLGLNAAFGPIDCATLTRSMLRERPGWIIEARGKTGSPRVCPLWPETVAALDDAAKDRPDPAKVEYADLVFLTRLGQPWVRDTAPTPDAPSVHCDAVGPEFRKLTRRVGVTVPGGFYTLRRTHRTKTDNLRDQRATGLLMGHSDGTVAGKYVQEVDDDRIVEAANLVRAWLLGEGNHA
jgi:integrase